MAWNGYVALGTVSGTTFTESVATGYVRKRFTFRSPLNGRVEGQGDVITFTTTAVTTSSVNAYAFFTLVSGGVNLLTYPMGPSAQFSVNVPNNLLPSQVCVLIADQIGSNGISLNLTNFGTISGLSASVPSVVLAGSTSGTLTVVPAAAASGTVTIPNGAGTVAFINPPSAQTWSGTNTIGGVFTFAAQTGVGLPVAGTNLAAGQCMIWKDTSGGTTKVFFNDGGVMKSVALV